MHLILLLIPQLDCIWTIKLPTELNRYNRLTIYMEDFESEDGYDFLWVKEGDEVKREFTGEADLDPRHIYSSHGGTFT